MKIKIKQFSKMKDHYQVHFETDIGEAAAIWLSQSNTPDIGNVYDAEFDVDDSIEIGKTAIHSDNKFYSMAIKNNIIELNGLVDSIDDDGMIYFRLGEDCLIMIESEIGNLKVGEWLLLKFNMEDFEISVQ